MKLFTNPHTNIHLLATQASNLTLSRRDKVIYRHILSSKEAVNISHRLVPDIISQVCLRLLGLRLLLAQLCQPLLHLPHLAFEGL